MQVTLQSKQEASARSAEWYARNVERKRAYNAEYRKRKSQKIEGQKTLMQAWEKARAPSDSAVLLPRSILEVVALASLILQRARLRTRRIRGSCSACTTHG